MEPDTTPSTRPDTRWMADTIATYLDGVRDDGLGGIRLHAYVESGTGAVMIQTEGDGDEMYRSFRLFLNEEPR